MIGNNKLNGTMTENCGTEPVLSMELKTQVKVEWLYCQQTDILPPKICGLFVPEDGAKRNIRNAVRSAGRHET